LKVAKSEANTIFQNKFNIFFTKSRVWTGGTYSKYVRETSCL
jgi:hypothetical protein